MTMTAALKKQHAQFLGHVKPREAIKHVPQGHTEMETCPTCKGKGIVKKADDVKARALRRV